MIDKLSPPLQMTLKIASVIGPRFSLEELMAMRPAEKGEGHLLEQLEQLAAAGLVVESEGGYAFANELVRLTIYDLMLFSQRRPLHRALADWYEHHEQADTVSHLACLAYHWQRAEEPAKAIHYLEEAGKQARQGGDLDRAVNFYNQALQLEAKSAVLSRDYQSA